MATLTRKWVELKACERNMPFAVVMEHQFSDNSLHYTMRGRHGRPCNLGSFEEAQKVIRNFDMEEVEVY